MTGIVSALFAAWWPQIVAVVGGLAAIAIANLRGRSAERQKLETQDLRDANDIRKGGTAARDDVAADIAAGRLRDDDGFKRRD